MLHLASFLPLAQEGHYFSEEIPSSEVGQLIRDNPDLHSAVQLETVRVMLEQMSGVRLPKPRETEDRLIHLKHGDAVLIARIKPGVRTGKDRVNPPEDYIFLLVEFEAE